LRNATVTKNVIAFSATQDNLISISITAIAIIQS